MTMGKGFQEISYDELMDVGGGECGCSVVPVENRIASAGVTGIGAAAGGAALGGILGAATKGATVGLVFGPKGAVIGAIAGGLFGIWAGWVLAPSGN